MALLAGLALALPGQAAECGIHNDFLVRSDALLAPVRPPDCSVVGQTPPDFSWPPQEGKNNTYTLSLTKPDGRTESRSTTTNWVAWPQALPPGDYTWTLQVKGDANYTSETRRFTIAPDAVTFIVPRPEEAAQRAKAKARPRTWTTDSSGPLAAVRAERAAGFKQLLANVDARIRNAPAAEPVSKSKDSNYNDVVAESKRALNSAFAWAMTRNPTYGADGMRRLMNLTAWSATGPISFTNNDMASRSVAWTLALGYDWMHDYLNPFQKAAILHAIKVRTQPMIDQVVPRIAKYPYDSHGNVTLTLLAAIAALTAGDIPEADQWMKAAFPMAVLWTSPWGWQDGGFGNGTAQMFWDTGENLIAWYVYRNAVGVDIARKEWVRNFSRAIAYFIPPGTPSGVFGDGHEMNLQEVWARVSKAYTAFAPSPIGAWYVQRVQGEDSSRLELLLAPRTQSRSGHLPADTAHAAWFPSIGWAAMHSSLADPMRASIYFKSSPYGSYNHSHADQNHFVVNYRGKRLAIASGYYDGYRTPHWTEWYKQTRSHNAITFDGGQGQGLDDRRFAGEITRFEHTPAYDFAIGRAEKAYGEEVTRAQRTLVYLRERNILVVYDVLASRTPRTWEWNLHALEPMVAVSDQKVGIASGDAQLCVEMVASPGVGFTQDDEFTRAPSNARMGKQWHGRFSTKRKLPAAEFIAVMRIGAECRPGAVAADSAQRVQGGWQVQVEGSTVTLTEGNVTVEARR